MSCARHRRRRQQRSMWLWRSGFACPRLAHTPAPSRRLGSVGLGSAATGRATGIAAGTPLLPEPVGTSGNCFSHVGRFCEAADLLGKSSIATHDSGVSSDSAPQESAYNRLRVAGGIPVKYADERLRERPVNARRGITFRSFRRRLPRTPGRETRRDNHRHRRTANSPVGTPR